MPERNCQLNTGLGFCGEEAPVCPIPQISYESKYRYYGFTDIPVRNLDTGELENPTLVKMVHTPDSIWDLWDLPLAEIQRNRAQIEARNLIQLQIKKKPRIVIQFPTQIPKVVESKQLVLSKRA